MNAMKTLSATARAAIDALVSDLQASPSKIARRGNDSRTVALVPACHPRYSDLAARLPAASRPVVGIVIVERLQRHEDSLSVTGYYLLPTDSHAPVATLVYLFAGDDGQPDMDFLCRDGGKLAKCTSAWA